MSNIGVALELQQLIAGLNLHKVRRFQTYLFSQPKSVAEHSFRVGMIYSYLGGSEVLAAIGHDLEEAVTSDIPGPIKKDLKGLDTFEDKYRIPFEDSKEKELCKLADLLELVLDLVEQQNLGNKSPKVLEIYDETMEDVMERARKLGKTTMVKKIMRELRKI